MIGEESHDMKGADEDQDMNGTEEDQGMKGTVVINEVGEEALAVMAEMGSALNRKHEGVRGGGGQGAPPPYTPRTPMTGAWHSTIIIGRIMDQALLFSISLQAYTKQQGFIMMKMCNWPGLEPQTTQPVKLVGMQQRGRQIYQIRRMDGSVIGQCQGAWARFGKLLAQICAAGACKDDLSKLKKSIMV